MSWTDKYKFSAGLLNGSAEDFKELLKERYGGRGKGKLKAAEINELVAKHFPGEATVEEETDDEAEGDS